MLNRQFPARDNKTILPRLAEGFLILLLVTQTSAQSKSAHVFGSYKGPKSLGSFSVDRSVYEKAFLASFGKKPTGALTYCFVDRATGLSLYANVQDDHSGRIAGVVLSSFPNCQNLPRFHVPIDGAYWATPEGIKIGSTKQEVLAAYGRPVFASTVGVEQPTTVIAGRKVDDKTHVDLGDSSFLYSCLLNEKLGCPDDLRGARMGFKNGKLIWIALSNSE